MKHPDLNILLGPPGTGKTTALLGIVERELQAGTSPYHIGFLAFTKKAAQEATERACQRFSFHSKQLPYFRTIHSMCFSRLGLKPDLVMQWRHYRELGDQMGLDLTPQSAVDDQFYGMDEGARMLFLEGLARVQQRPLDAVYQEAQEPDISYMQLDQLARSLALYKQRKGLMDYTDMLEEFVRQGRVAAPTLDCLIVDEAQDLSPVQWQVVDAIAAKAKRVYVAGDDLQAIYVWSGADVKTFLGLQGKTRVLEQSYRIPAKVHALASSISARVRVKSSQVYKPRAEAGAVNWYLDPEEIDMGPGTGTWLLLARNGYMLNDLEAICRQRGYSYESVGKNNPLSSPALKAIISYTRLCRGIPLEKPEAEHVLKFASVSALGPGVRNAVRKWTADRPITVADLQAAGFPTDPPIWVQMLDKVSEDDREYFIAARRQGETLTGTPRVRISTIHAAKGGEADNVLLLTDMSARTFREMDRKPDDEHKCWYVAVTRARKALHLVQPRTGNCYEL